MIIGLSAYRIQIKERFSDEWWQIQRDSPKDAFSEFDGYLKSRYKNLIRLGDPDIDGNYKDQRALMLTKVERSKDEGMLAGIFYKGEAGMVREIRDFDDPQAEAKYKTAINEGILTPLYFRMHFEDGKRYGVILLQTMGIDGIKGYMDRDLQRYFLNEVSKKRKTKITQLVDRQILDAFATKGILQDVILVNYGKTETSRQAMRNHTVAGEKLGSDGDKLEFRLARKGGFKPEYFRRFWEQFKKNGDTKKLVKTNDMSSYDDLKVEIKYGGRTQRFSLVNPDDSPIRMDITDQVRFNNGIPTWTSIHDAAEEAWQNISLLINGGTNG